MITVGFNQTLYKWIGERDWGILECGLVHDNIAPLTKHEKCLQKPDSYKSNNNKLTGKTLLFLLIITHQQR